MNDKELYDKIMEYAFLDYSDPEGISKETAYEICPPGWKTVIDRAYKIGGMLTFKITRILHDNGKMWVTVSYDDPDLKRMSIYFMKYVRIISRRLCLMTGKQGKRQWYVKTTPVLSWSYAAKFANTYYEENGYDGLYEPLREEFVGGNEFNFRGRYRDSTPARRFYIRPDGEDGVSGAGESS